MRCVRVPCLAGSLSAFRQTSVWLRDQRQAKNLTVSVWGPSFASSVVMTFRLCDFLRGDLFLIMILCFFNFKIFIFQITL